MDIDRNAPARSAAATTIAAPIETVWRVQAELERWPEWNPDVARIEVLGPVAPGTVFRWKAGGLNIVSELRVVDPPHTIGWTGRAFGLRAVHVWRFTEIEDGTRVHTEESFDGWLARLLPGTMKRALDSALEKGLAALRAECERATD